MKVVSTTVIGGLEAGVRIAGYVVSLPGEIVTEACMNDGSCRVERGFGVGYGGQFIVIDIDEVAGVFRFGARARHHGADGLAAPKRSIYCDGVLRRGFDSLEVS